MDRRNREGKTERRRHYKMRQRRENGKGIWRREERDSGDKEEREKDRHLA